MARITSHLGSKYAGLLLGYALLCLIAVGCGGGGGGGTNPTPTPTPDSATLAGQALGGAPVNGLVYVKDNASPAKQQSANIGADGSFTLSINVDWQSPMLLWTEGSVNGQPARLFSQISLTEGQTSATVHINPLTTAVVCAAMGKAAAEVDPETAVIPAQTAVDTASSNLMTGLAELWTAFAAPADFNPFTSALTIGDGVDQAFDLLDFDANTQGGIQVASRRDAALLLSIDTAGTVSGDVTSFVAQVSADQEMLAQMAEALEKQFELFRISYPDAVTLENELKPYMAPGYLNFGDSYDSFATNWANQEGAPPGLGSELASLSIHRPVRTQFYGNQNIDEMPDSYEEGLWAVVNIRRNGITRAFTTVFVDVGGGSWKLYGNRCAVLTTSRGQARSIKEIIPGGVTNYEPGFSMYHRDRGDVALNTGITKLAILNPALPSFELDGEMINCVQMARKDGGSNERFGFTNIPGITGSWIGEVSGKGYNRTSLVAQSQPEFVVFSLDDADQVQGVWIYLVNMLPPTTQELIDRDAEWFATLAQPVNFNNIAIPGTTSLSWDLPADDTIYPGWLSFGWHDEDWIYSGQDFNSPAWYDSSDFFDWLEQDVEVDITPPNGIIRRVNFDLNCYSATDDRSFVMHKEYSPHTDQIIQPKNNVVEMTVERQWASTNLSNRLTGHIWTKGVSQINRFEAKFTVTAVDTSGSNVDAETLITLMYQPDEIWDRPGWTQEHLFNVTVRLRANNGRMWLQGWMEGFVDADETMEYPVPEPVGNFPFDETIVLGRIYTLAVECDPVAKTLTLEFDGKRSTADLSGIEDFNPADVKRAELKTRVRDVESAGDSGLIKVEIDDVKVNGELFDDFTDGLAPNKWNANSYE